MPKTLKNSYLTVGATTYGPGDEVPDDVDTDQHDPALFEDTDVAEEHDNEEVSGFGQFGPPEDQEAIETRRTRDRERKTAARAAARQTKSAADEQAVRDAQDAEARRAAEGGGS